jgi:THO complex subunit 2
VGLLRNGGADMAPPGGGKRKRVDRTWSGDSSHDGQRPSPHRPGNLNLAQQTQGPNSLYGRDAQDSRGRGGRRPSRGGRGALQGQNSMNGSTSTSLPDQRALSPAITAVGNLADATKAAEVAVASPKLLAPNSSTPEPQPDNSLFDYTYLTDEVCTTWDATGRQVTLEIGIKAKEEGDGLILSSLFQELVHAALSNRLPATKAGKLVKDIVGDEDVTMLNDALTSASPPGSQAAFLDALSIITDASSGLSNTSLQSLVFSTGISPDVLRQELEASLLESLGLIRSTFARMGIRKQTNILYRQANFNLMREESEGFAKLMTELFTTSNNEPPTSEVVEETVERVKAMIGAFDLDVGRTLDVVLDVFGAVLVKQFRFFVKFLRASPWWPRDGSSGKGGDDFQNLGGLPQWALPSSSAWYLNDDQKDEVARQREDRDQQFWIRAQDVGIQAFYELGRQRVRDEKRSSLTSSASPESANEEDSTKDWIQRTGTTPPPGNRDAAQLLGFKLRFYSSSDARTEHDVLPENLIYLSALLIKVGFISLKDLYPHIWRTDEGMEELRKEKFKEKVEKERAARPGANAKNALLMAGALADDTLPIPPRLRETNTRASTPVKDADAEQSKAPPKDAKNLLPEPIDQKVLLLQSLLAIGALPDALFILGRFPWLLEIYPDLTEYLLRILHHSLSQVYASIRPLSSRSSLQEQRPSSETDVPGLPKGQVKLVDAPTRKTLRWALLDRDDTGLDGLDYRFYWDEWSDTVPLCQSVDDVFILCETFLNLSGVKIGQDTALLSKFARIGKHSLANDRSESNRSRWFDLCKRLLIPALSFTKSNAGVVNEVFEVLNAFPLHMRYTIYLEWSAGQTSRSPDMKFVFELAKAETRDVLKRISKTNLRPMARALAKIAYANPHIVITTALNQIEVYDSIADTFVEGARYFTDLGYDILTWALISSMARAGRSRVQEGGIFTSKWLAALASFTGKIFRRYNFMRPGPVLQYVADQLGKGNSRDLVVLEQVILSMAGITTDTNYNDAQIQAMGGGELLQSQTILQLHDRRHESKLTSKRLMRSLRDMGLTGKLLISLAHRRQACVFDSESEDTNLKVLGNTFDELHRVMVQYVDLLRSNLSLEELQSIIPDVVQLLLDYGLNPEVAFWISRPVIAQRMVEADREDSEKKRVEGDVSKELTNGDIEMADQLNGAAEEDGEAVETGNSPENAATPTPAEISGTTLNSEVSDMQAASPLVEGGMTSLNWHPVLQEIMDAIRPKLPKEILDIVGVGFYVTFWQLSLYDITIPGKAYEDELSRQHKRMAVISADRADISVAGTRRKEIEKKNISELVDRLLKENKDHLKAFAESKARLQREKDQWFAGMSRKYEQLNSALMEYCFLPRILHSPLDSFFCFKFAKLLHSSGTPNFRTLGFYDLIFRQERLTSLIFTCTSKESDNLGRFLNEILRDLARWHREKTLYEREAYGSKRNLPGFTMQLDSEGKPVTFLSYEDYRRILYRWHCVVFSALQACLSSAEYMHIRNAISVLRSISQHFPAINFHGTALQKTITSLSTSDKADIVVSSKALIGTLTRQEKSWVLPASFRKGQDKPVNGEKDASQDTTAPQPASDSSTAKEAKSVPSAPLR